MKFEKKDKKKKDQRIYFTIFWLKFLQGGGIVVSWYFSKFFSDICYIIFVWISLFKKLNLVIIVSSNRIYTYIIIAI